jgi:hypothetical protein
MATLPGAAPAAPEVSKSAKMEIEECIATGKVLAVLSLAATIIQMAICLAPILIRPSHASPGARAESAEACDLRLMSWGDGSGVPTSGSNLIIVGIDHNGLLHIRIFDAKGDEITDTDETKLPGTQAGAVSALKKRFPGLLPPHVLTGPEKAQLVSEATSIVGQTPAEMDVSPVGGRAFYKRVAITWALASATPAGVIFYWYWFLFRFHRREATLFNRITYPGAGDTRDPLELFGSIWLLKYLLPTGAGVLWVQLNLVVLFMIYSIFIMK